MKIMYVCRLFSGLAKSVRTRNWEPEGVPTVYRLIEALDDGNHDLRLILTVKDKAVGWQPKTTSTFSIDGLKSPVTVVQSGFPKLNWIKYKSGYLRELAQYVEVWRQLTEFKPDLIYFDRVNVYLAALMSYRTNIPVVWRLMGVPPAMHDTVNSTGGLVNWITRRAYRAPFSLVICSQDGSGGAKWMRHALASDTPRKLLINGADGFSNETIPNETKHLFSDTKTKVLFVSRLVENKGCSEFIKAACKVLDQVPNNFSFLVVGSGPLEKSMRALAGQSPQAENIHFLGEQPHRYILPLQKASDIYVSLNQMCNLTNANLEAMRAGACMIIPASSGFRDIDVDTDQLMPAEFVWRVNTYDDIKGLIHALIYLHSNPTERRDRGNLTASHGSKIIPLWEDRIQTELNLLSELTATG